MNVICLQKAAAVFAGYYQSSAPGIYLTPPVVNSLLSVLLKAGLVPDIVHVLNVCAARKILPSPDFLLALFNHVREKAVLSLVPDLMHLTAKMVDAGLAINMDDCKRILCNNELPSPPMDTQIPASALHRSLIGKTTISDTKYLANAIQEVELCAQQEDWCRLGAVFRSVCLTLKGLSELQHFSGCVAIALLTETKDRLALPFATFSYTVCQENSGDGLVKSFLGRIGISLMFRYHKNQQWAKGQRLVEVLTRMKVNYSTLKGLFGNEDGVSRCRLVSMATELFLRSGSVEGALNTLRDNKWFLGSSLWPCEPTDVIERTNMLVCLAKKTSHRDTLEVLTNLPGLQEPTDVGSMSQYESLFNSHLSVCVERQTLPVAADTLDFMLSKSLAVEPPLLHTLLHKLGKQNVWLRARSLFKCSLCGGYYPGVSAAPGSLALTVPCSLGEIEMALAFEMFITLNAAAIFSTPDPPVCLSISLTRTLDCESGYLSAGSRLLSAAIIPNPKLTVRYRAVNSSNEQMFLLDTPSARRWLQQNQSWASEVWTQTT
ncbi:protein TOPAZ1 [Hypomesus transpacificus]|uniref:protein TOPAZ1 n=1 Tax=Hypomesus transpacificus TaxID=137520 RepID=UPI001F073A15|nr:protein TOPAZ1 [Hypomesus transpacificus]